MTSARPTMSEDEIRRRLREYDFYHVIRVTDGIRTPGVERFVPYQEVTLGALRSLDLGGRRVLDVGCRDGLFSFEAERLGAAEVIGIDNNLSRGAVEFLIPLLGSAVRMHELNLVDLTVDRFGTFDVVILSGVLYHLRYPFWGLKRVTDVLVDGGILLLETALLLDQGRFALLHCPVGDESPYEPTSVAFFNRKGLEDTLESFGLSVLGFKRLSPWHTMAGARCREIARRLLGRPWRKVVDRATLICEKTSDATDRHLHGYWNLTHETRGWR